MTGAQAARVRVQVLPLQVLMLRRLREAEIGCASARSARAAAWEAAREARRRHHECLARARDVQAARLESYARGATLGVVELRRMLARQDAVERDCEAAREARRAARADVERAREAFADASARLRGQIKRREALTRLLHQTPRERRVLVG